MLCQADQVGFSRLFKYSSTTLCHTSQIPFPNLNGFVTGTGHSPTEPSSANYILHPFGPSDILLANSHSHSHFEVFGASSLE